MLRFLARLRAWRRRRARHEDGLDSASGRRVDEMVAAGDWAPVGWVRSYDEGRPRK